MTRWLRAIAPCLAVLAVLGLATPAGANPPAAGAGSQGTSAPPTMSSALREPAQLDERPRLTIAQEVRRNDHQTAYLGAAVVVLGVMVWWNRRRRERFEREDRPAPAARSEHDDDADALHAAARGNTPDTPDTPDTADASAGGARRDAPTATGTGRDAPSADAGGDVQSSARPEASEAGEARETR